MPAVAQAAGLPTRSWRALDLQVTSTTSSARAAGMWGSDSASSRLGTTTRSGMSVPRREGTEIAGVWKIPSHRESRSGGDAEFVQQSNGDGTREHALTAVLQSVRHRSQHAERDRWGSTGPVHPIGETPGQAMRSSTTGDGVKSVPGAAMS